MQCSRPGARFLCDRKSPSSTREKIAAAFVGPAQFPAIAASPSRYLHRSIREARSLSQRGFARRDDRPRPVGLRGKSSEVSCHRKDLRNEGTTGGYKPCRRVSDAQSATEQCYWFA